MSAKHAAIIVGFLAMMAAAVVLLSWSFWELFCA